MMTEKPRNINDVDLQNGDSNIPQPLSTPTDMSYSIQRIRLAEIAKEVVDNTWTVQATSSASPNYADVMGVDIKLAAFIDDMPQYLRMEVLGASETTAKQSLVVQAYFLNQFVHTQRCRLHLPYLFLTSPTANAAPKPIHAYSRDICLSAARSVITNEVALERSLPSFARTRLKLPGLLYGVFIASIALCAGAADSSTSSEAAIAFRILEAAKGESLAAENLLNSLRQILRRLKDQRVQPDDDPRRDGSVLSSTATLPNIGHTEWQANRGSMMEDTDVPMLLYDEFGQGLGGLEGLPWDEIFTELDTSSSSFFC